MPTKSAATIGSSNTLTITLQDLAFKEICLLILWLQRAGFSMGCTCKRKKSGSKKIIFPHCSYDAQRSPALQKNQALFFPRYSLKLKEARLCKKTTFQAVKIASCHTALMKLREARLCRKKYFSNSKKLFLALTL